MRNALAILYVFIGGVLSGALIIGILTRYTDAMCREPLEMHEGLKIAACSVAMLFLARWLWRSPSPPLRT